MVTARLGVLGFGLVVGAWLGTAPIQAGTIVNVDSNLTGIESNSVTGTDVAIPDLGPDWQPNGPNSFWISYADTGFAVCLPGNSNPAPCPQSVTGTITLPDPAPPTATFFKTFSLPDADNVGSISVWADDTARVYLCAGTANSTSACLDPTLLIDANPNLGSNCTSSPIGCLAGEEATFDFPGTDSYTGGSLNLGVGTYTLEIQAYQLGGGPFGVMYEGSFDSSAPTGVPEPASLALLGLGLAGLGCIARRKQRG
jgi:hypothetical protein